MSNKTKKTMPKEPMKMTAKLETLMKRYSVGLRKGVQVVEHMTYKTKTAITAVQFACFEVCIKAQDWARTYAKETQTGIYDPEYRKKVCVIEHCGGDDWTEELFKRNGIERIRPAAISGEQAETDYLYCHELICKDGLYGALLD